MSSSTLSTFGRQAFPILALALLVGLWLPESNASGLKLESLSRSQKSAIKRLRLVVKDALPHEYMKEDYYLLRWLTMRNFNVEQTVTFLKQNVKWRQEYRIDNILKEDWAEFHQDFPYYLSTVDKQGRPILYFNFGSWDIAELANAGSLKSLTRYFAKLLEDAEARVRKIKADGGNVTQFNLLINLEGYSIAKHGCYQCISFYTEVGQTLQDHYPGTANRIVFINAQSLFASTFALLETVLSEQTKDAIKLFGDDRYNWEPALLGFMDRDQFPGDLY